MLRCASGRDGVVRARRHPLSGTSPGSGGLTASDLDTRSPTILTMVNSLYKLDLTLATVNRTLPNGAPFRPRERINFFRPGRAWAQARRPHASSGRKARLVFL